MNVQAPVKASYNSHDNNAAAEASYPPTISTFPVLSTCAVPLERGPAILPVAVHVPLPELYTSHVAIAEDVPSPPIINTVPSPSRTAEWFARIVAMLPVGDHVPVDGL